MTEAKPTAPETLDELQAMMPWAHIEERNAWDGDVEIVIYTGLRRVLDPETEEATNRLEWIEGMEEANNG